MTLRLEETITSRLHSDIKIEIGFNFAIQLLTGTAVRSFSLCAVGHLASWGLLSARE